MTLEVFGEGNSEGPINETTRQDIIDSGGFGGADVNWTTLDEYLQFLIDRGISTNIASFIGATTERKHEIDYEDRAPTAGELARMHEMVRRAMIDRGRGWRGWQQAEEPDMPP